MLLILLISAFFTVFISIYFINLGYARLEKHKDKKNKKNKDKNNCRIEIR